ncbi:WGR domain-containing protein [Saprospira grandis]|uniref:WGR domain-containing protein n=1 Tax=Saprospira grandis TaxID=1008 RepID=UPI0022DDEB9A|nr:WGR domain-containing protein [Saprospira grandis]WBM75370.1 WGR domain-containing protein [Saprospira grandis]
MKLIEQKRLHFKQGNSDKVYEVDLCELEAGAFLVNFRYGKTGGPLREGSKTPTPVDETKARSLYNKLLQDKMKKGYLDVSEKSQAKQVAAIQPPDKSLQGAEAQAAWILYHLQLAQLDPAAQKARNWKLSRVAWRAASLNIKAAGPYCWALFEQNHRGKSIDDMELYSLLWATAQLDTAVEDPSNLLTFWRSKKKAPTAKKLAPFVYWELADAAGQQALLEEELPKLPELWQKALDRKDNDALAYQLRKAKGDKSMEQAFAMLYLLSPAMPYCRKTLVEVICEMEFRPNSFRLLSRLFKMATFRKDAQFWGALAYRFEKASPQYRMPRRNNQYVWVSYNRMRPKDELTKENSRLAFSNLTKDYFSDYMRKELDQLGQKGDIAYVAMATSLLLQYDDSRDGRTDRREKNWRFDNKKQRWIASVYHYPSYSKELIFNEILYANSQRYVYSSMKQEWVYGKHYDPDMPLPAPFSETKYADLWRQEPKAFLHLMAEAKSQKVLEFAHTAFMAHPEAKSLQKRLGLSYWKQLLSRSYQPLQTWALQEIVANYEKSGKPTAILLYLLDHDYAKAREQALAWLEADFFDYFADLDLVYSLLLHQRKDLRNWAQEALGRIVEVYEPAKRQALLGRLLGFLLRSGQDQQVLMREVESLLKRYFVKETQQLSLDLIGKFLRLPLAQQQAFGLHLLKGHAADATQIPFEDIQYLFGKTADYWRYGLELLRHSSEQKLLQEGDFLLGLLEHPEEDVRLASREVLAPLYAQNQAFAVAQMQALLRKLIRKEKIEGLHALFADILTSELEGHLAEVDRKFIFRLLNAKYAPAQELAAVLIDRYIPYESLSVANTVRLANHEIVAVRELAWKMFKEQKDRMRYEREEALRLLDVDWADSRQFAFDFFGQSYTADDWNPSLMVGICDSVRQDVQQFGRQLITRFFEEEDGPMYLEQLSQHPRPELQLYATNYLERFGAGHPERILSLRDYFYTVLAQVNKGRMAKDRIWSFLAKEAKASFEVAQFLSDLATFISATAAIGDKEQAVIVLRDLQDQYPLLEQPIAIHDYPTQS